MADLIESAVAETTTSEAPADAVESSVEPGSEVEGEQPPLTSEISEPGSAADKEAAKDEPAKEPEAATQKESAIARALRSREGKLVERQTAFAREREEWNSYTERLKPQIAAFNEERELATKDPFAWLEKVHGIGEGDLARRWINGGEPSKQETERKAQSKLDAELAELKEWRASQEREKREASERTQRETSQRAAETKLVELTKANASKFPAASRLSQADLIEEANTIAMTSKVALSFAQILEKIESRAKRYGATSTALPSTENAAQTAIKGTEKQGQKGQEAEAAKSGANAPTLNGKTASQRTSMPKDDPLMLTPEQERERAIAAIDRVKRERASA